MYIIIFCCSLLNGSQDIKVHRAKNRVSIQVLKRACERLPGTSAQWELGSGQAAMAEILAAISDTMVSPPLLLVVHKLHPTICHSSCASSCVKSKTKK